MDARERDGNTNGPPVLTRVLGDHDGVLPCRCHQRTLRCDREIAAHAHDRAALPSGAFVPAGVNAAHSGSEPRIAGKIHRKNTPVDLVLARLLFLAPLVCHVRPILQALLCVETRFAGRISCRLHWNIFDQVHWLPRGCVGFQREDAAICPGQHRAFRRLRQGKHIAPFQPIG